MLRLIVLLACTLLLFEARNFFLTTDEVIYQSLGERLSTAQIEKMFEQRDRYFWLPYVFIPVFYLIKLSLVSICLGVGMFIFNLKPSLRLAFSVSVKAEFVLLLPSVITIVWFYFFQASYTLEDVQNFAPLSMVGLFDANSLEPWERYPLTLLNLCELIYVLILANGIRNNFHQDFNQSLKIVLVSYGSGLVIWTLFIVFIVISFS
jgi:hypothetical protein